MTDDERAAIDTELEAASAALDRAGALIPTGDISSTDRRVWAKIQTARSQVRRARLWLR